MHSMKGVMMLSVCVVVAFNVCGLCFLCGCIWIVRCHVCYVVYDEDGCVYASYLPFEERLTAVPSLWPLNPWHTGFCVCRCCLKLSVCSLDMLPSLAIVDLRLEIAAVFRIFLVRKG